MTEDREILNSRRHYNDLEKERILNVSPLVKYTVIELNAILFYRAAAVHGYDAEDFIEKFMNSATARLFDMALNFYRWEGVPAIMADFIIECQDTGIILKKAENQDEIHLEVVGSKAEWIGYIYRLTHYMTGLSSAEIIDLMPVKEMMFQFHAGHTTDPERWVDKYLDTECMSCLDN